jgi:membrane protein DedA with SNARE-associated domain
MEATMEEKSSSGITPKENATATKLLSRYGWMGVFIAASTPIPDDIVYIPLGLAKYSPLSLHRLFLLASYTRWNNSSNQHLFWKTVCRIAA